MKTFILIILLAAGVFFTGFFAEYLFTRTDTNTPLNPTTKLHNAKITSSALTAAMTTATGFDLLDAKALTYEDIVTESSIFSQLKLAYLLADAADVEDLKSYIL